MTWKDALRKHLNSPASSTTDDQELAERRSGQLEHLRLIMRIVARVLREAHSELLVVNRRATFEYGHELTGLVLDGRRLEVRLVDEPGSEAIAVRRHGASDSLLWLRDGSLVDEKGTRILSPEAYFGWLVLDLVVPGSAQAH
ncbi:MAG: hypothetical protein ACO1OB_10595 [Archangium sp.]